MPISVKHRRADEATWLRINPILPDGEIALTSTPDGYNIKVGDGVLRYSELPTDRDRIIDEEYAGEATVVMDHGTDQRLANMYELKIIMPHAPRRDYYSVLSFDTDAEMMLTLEADYPIFFSGTSVEAGEFIPRGNTHYTLMFWYDGAMQCNVRSYSYETT